MVRATGWRQSRGARVGRGGEWKPWQRSETFATPYVMTTCGAPRALDCDATAARSSRSRVTAGAAPQPRSSNGRGPRARSRWWLRGRGRRWREEEPGLSQPKTPTPRGLPGAAAACSSSTDASGRRGGPRDRRRGGVARLSPRPWPLSRALSARPCPARPAPVWQRLMAAVGPPQQQVRMAHQQAWAVLEVVLRVPCLYIIDAIFNSYYDSSQSRFCIGLQIFLRLLGKGEG